MRKPTFMDRVMAEPVALGGVVWSYGFLLLRLGNNSMALLSATRRSPSPALPDARSLSEPEQRELWDAMGEGSMEIISRYFRAMPDFAA